MTGQHLSLIVGVDGGGTKTAARVIAVRPDGSIEVLGDGYGGPSNVRAVAPVHAKTNLDVAIDAAHEAAGTRDVAVDCAVLALAGSALVRAAIGRLKLLAVAPLVLAGGVACSGEFFRAELLERLDSLGIRPDPVTMVTRPVEGSLIMARDRLLSGARR